MSAASITWLPALAVGTLGAGLALRTFLAAGLSPVGEALAAGLLLLGGGLVLADRATKWNLPARLVTYALPCVVAWHVSRSAGDARLRAVDLLALTVAAIALRDAVMSRAAGSILRRALVAVGFMFGLLGLAQVLYLRPSMTAELIGSGAPLSTTEMGRAFLASWRATGVFTSANVFASAFLVTLMPCVVLSLAASKGRIVSVLFGVLGIAGLCAAGSAGAATAVVVGGAIGWAMVEARPAKIRTARWLAASVVAAAVAIVVAARLAPDAANKLGTLNERLDYWTTALRALFPTTMDGVVALLSGTGPGSADARMTAASRPDAAFSRDPHQAILTMALEFGVPFALAACAVVGGRLASARGSLRTVSALGASLVRDPAKRPVARDARAWAVGFAVGTLLAGLMQRLITFFPAGVDAPALVDAAVWTVLGVVAWKLAGFVDVSGDDADLAWWCGTTALVAHAMIDVHVRIPAILTLAAVAFATLPGPGPCPTIRGRSLGRLAAVLLGVFAVLASLPIVLDAQSLVSR